MKKFLLTLLMIVLVAGVGVGCYFIGAKGLFNKDDDKGGDTPGDTPAVVDLTKNNVISALSAVMLDMSVTPTDRLVADNEGNLSHLGVTSEKFRTKAELGENWEYMVRREPGSGVSPILCQIKELVLDGFAQHLTLSQNFKVNEKFTFAGSHVSSQIEGAFIYTALCQVSGESASIYLKNDNNEYGQINLTYSPSTGAYSFEIYFDQNSTENGECSYFYIEKESQDAKDFSLVSYFRMKTSSSNTSGSSSLLDGNYVNSFTGVEVNLRHEKATSLSTSNISAFELNSIYSNFVVAKGINSLPTTVAQKLA